LLFSRERGAVHPDKLLSDRLSVEHGNVELPCGSLLGREGAASEDVLLEGP
jgi:hypothetical protein